VILAAGGPKGNGAQYRRHFLPPIRSCSTSEDCGRAPWRPRSRCRLFTTLQTRESSSQKADARQGASAGGHPVAPNGTPIHWLRSKRPSTGLGRRPSMPGAGRSHPGLPQLLHLPRQPHARPAPPTSQQSAPSPCPAQRPRRASWGHHQVACAAAARSPTTSRPSCGLQLGKVPKLTATRLTVVKWAMAWPGVGGLLHARCWANSPPDTREPGAPAPSSA